MGGNALFHALPASPSSADGEMQIGARVPLEGLKSAMEDWFRRKSYLYKEAQLILEEM